MRSPMSLAVGAIAVMLLWLVPASAVIPVRAQGSVASPKVTVIPPPDFWGAYAIWGATGASLRLRSGDDDVRRQGRRCRRTGAAESAAPQRSPDENPLEDRRRRRRVAVLRIDGRRG